MYRGTMRCEHCSNHQIGAHRAIHQQTSPPPPPSTRCPRTPQGRGLRPVRHGHTERRSHRTRASTADKEEGRSKAGEATRTGNQNGGDGRACTWEAATTKGMAWRASAVATGCQGNPCSTGIRWGVSPAAQMDYFHKQEREPTRGRLAMREKGSYGGRPGQCVEEKGTWASHTRKHTEAGYGQPEDGGVWTAKTVKGPRQQPAQPQIRHTLGAADTQTAHHATTSTAPATPTTGLRERGNDTSKSTGRSG